MSDKARLLLQILAPWTFGFLQGAILFGLPLHWRSVFGVDGLGRTDCLLASLALQLALSGVYFWLGPRLHASEAQAGDEQELPDLSAADNWNPPSEAIQKGPKKP